MNLRRSGALAASLSFVLLALALASPAEAVKLRRPYNENIAFNYGFDNNYGSAGCTDYNCGSHCYDGHTGTDHAMGVGTNILAGEDGTVTATNNSCNNYGYIHNPCGGRCGNYVKIQHADGQYSLYCHMKRNAHTVSVGDQVSCGQKIGESASSGSSTGPHLHLSWQTGSNRRDSFRGQCTSSPGVWRDQRGYREPVGTSCGCTPSAEVCDGEDNNCDGEADEGEVCEKDLLNRSPNSYAPPATTDINGDGLQDACGRYAAGWGCYLATGDGWGEKVESALMPDEDGWDKPYYYATIRTGDVDGDGRADVCGRHSQGYRCWRSTGDAFELYADIPGYTNDAGWTEPGYYTTFRLADINGDGKDDVCARGPRGWSCQISTGTGFGDTIAGPGWDDDSGYNHAWYYGTIRTGDINADGKQDVCIRRSAGFDCYTSTGTSFERFAVLEDFSNDGGWKAMKYWSTLRLIDYNGDGKDDVCARFYSGYRCMKATDDGFGSAEDIAPVNDELGWDDIGHYLTVRAGDVDGDGSENMCVRGTTGIDCFSNTGSAITGPRWKDASGWGKARYYSTIAITDIDADRRRDICARAAAGLLCTRAVDDGFESISELDSFSNDKGWDKEKYYSTLRLGEGRCSAEVCNGFDDDCDGTIDEGSPAQMGPVGPAIAAEFVDATLPEEAESGTTVEAIVRFKNVGSTPWGAGQIELHAVADPADALDAIRPPSGWSTPTTPAAVDQAVAPGEIATLNFSVRAPEDPASFEQVLFVLNAGDTPIACPSPTTSLSLGITEPDGNTNNTPGGDAGAQQPDGGQSDAGAPERDSEIRSASASSCACSSSNNPPSPLSSALWPGLFMLSFFWMRRRKSTRNARSTAHHSMIALLMIAPLLTVGLMGCDAPGASPDEGQAVPAKAESTASLEYLPVPPADEAPASAPLRTPKRLETASTRLLGAYGDWELRGHPLAALPHSDQAPQMVVELSHRAKPVDWPMGSDPISNAVFVPTDSDTSATVAVRTPNARLVLVVLDTEDPAKTTVRELDKNLGLIVTAAQNGCCLAYMRGALGDQTTLSVLTLKDEHVRNFSLAHNAWSPALSPDGQRVAYTAPSATGGPAIYMHNLKDSHANHPTNGRLLSDKIDVFPSGPQPPFWSERGILFSAERGAYRMNTRGRIVEGAPDAQGLVLNFYTGELRDGAGAQLKLHALK